MLNIILFKLNVFFNTHDLRIPGRHAFFSSEMLFDRWLYCTIEHNAHAYKEEQGACGK
jgi:hypothetical protein